MTWSSEIAAAYRWGLKDGKNGRPPLTTMKFQASYAEGYLHSAAQRRRDGNG